MQLSKYISELLYRYECVMIPNFGGFVCNTISSQLDGTNHVFTPPTKSISFNVNLQQNDGLLVNHIANALNTSFDEAATLVQNTIEKWQNDLQQAPLLLDGIGQFTLVDNQLRFEPIDKINYLTSSFGLSDVDTNFILRNNIVPPVEIEEEEFVVNEETNTVVRKKKPYLKYMGAAAVLAGLFLGGNMYINNLANQQEIAAQEKITSQIQQASFNILSPLPSITLTVEKETTVDEIVEEKTITTYKYHIIAGAFKDANNAQKKVDILDTKGYNATIIGLNKWGLTQVSYASYNNKREAINMLNQIRKADNKHAWLLVNE